VAARNRRLGTRCPLTALGVDVARE